LALLSDITIQVCNAGAFVVGLEIIDNDRRNECLPRPRNPWAEQRLLASLQPILIFCGVQKPLASSGLSLADVAMLRVIVDFREPIED
jgi:hypothetical protein